MDIISSATVSQNATVCQSRSRCKNPLNLVTMCRSSSAIRCLCRCLTRSVWMCQGSNAARCQFRDRSRCPSNRAIRCLRRSASKFQSKSRNRFLQKFPKRFARTVMDMAEGMVALLVLMVLADLLVDSTEANLVDILAALAVGRVVLGGHDGIQSKHIISQPLQITKVTQCSRQQAKIFL